MQAGSSGRTPLLQLRASAPNARQSVQLPRSADPAILLEQIKRDLQVSDTALGFLGGFAFALFYSLAGLPIARLADRGNRRTLAALGIALWSAACALFGTVGGFVQLALLRFGVGVGEAALTPCAHSMLSDYFPPAQRATVLSIYTIGAQLGLAVGLPFGGSIATHYGWRPAFLAVALPGLPVALAVRLSVREPTPGQLRRNREHLGFGVLRPGAWSALASAVVPTPGVCGGAAGLLRIRLPELGAALPDAGPRHVGGAARVLPRTDSRPGAPWARSSGAFSRMPWAGGTLGVTCRCQHSGRGCIPSPTSRETPRSSHLRSIRPAAMRSWARTCCRWIRRLQAPVWSPCLPST